MSNATDYLEKKHADHDFGLTTFTKPTAVYAALHGADPTDTGSLANEITNSFGMPRVSITGSMNAGHATSGLIDNSTQIELGPVNADAGTVTHITTQDALTAGNALLRGAATANRTLYSGDSYRFAAGQLNATFQ